MNTEAEGRTGDATRPSLDLSGAWKVSIASDDALRTSVGLDTDDSEWPEMNVPGHWQGPPLFATSNGPLL